MAVTNASATAFSNQKHGRTLSTGRLVTVYSDTGTNGKFKYSDDGVTWTDFAADIAGWANGSIDVYVDSGAVERIVAVWKQSGTGGGRTDQYVYAMVGTFNAGRTTITWGTALLIRGNVNYAYPDVVCHPEGTGGTAHAVTSYTLAASNVVVWQQVTIDSSGAPTITTTTQISADYAVNLHTFPSIDINLTDKRLHVAWSAGTTGAGKGIRYRTASYSAGAWTWATEVEVDTARYIVATYTWLNCRWDGTRAVIGGMLYNGASFDLYQYESTNFTSFPTTRILASGQSNNGDTNGMCYLGSLAIDTPTGDVYYLGTNLVVTNVSYYKFTRATTTFSTRTITDATYMGTQSSAFISTWFSGSTVRWIYTAGNNSPYSVKYDQLVLNQTPNVPTALSRVLPNTVTTPTFQASISDPDTGQQVKARFQLFQSDGVTSIGTVDSGFVTTSGTVTAQYASALSVGTYKVAAAAVDAIGAISAYSAQITFYVTSDVPKDSILVWNVAQLSSHDTILVWNVLASNSKDIVLLWNVTTQVVLDRTLLWTVNTPWINKPFDPNAPEVWTEVLP